MKNCIFCQIVTKQAEAYVIKENTNAVAFLDLYPNSQGHALIIPKKHYPNWSSCDEASLASVAILTKQVSLMIQKTFRPLGVNYLSNEGKLARQVIFHYHVHIIPKYHQDEGLILSANVDKEIFNYLALNHTKIKQDHPD